jgi:hypothetical protein
MQGRLVSLFCDELEYRYGLSVPAIATSVFRLVWHQLKAASAGLVLLPSWGSYASSGMQPKRRRLPWGSWM